MLLVVMDIVWDLLSFKKNTFFTFLPLKVTSTTFCVKPNKTIIYFMIIIFYLIKVKEVMLRFYLSLLSYKHKFASKCFTTGSLGERAPICSVCQFLGKYSRCGQFQAVSTTSVHMGLRRDVR